jgi:hypothetical protein
MSRRGSHRSRCNSATRRSTSLVCTEGVCAISTERKKGRSRSGRVRPNGRRTDFRCCFWLATCSKEVDTAYNNEVRSSTTSTLASFLPRCLRDFLKKSTSLYHRLIELVILHLHCLNSNASMCRLHSVLYIFSVKSVTSYIRCDFLIDSKRSV